MKYLVEIPEEMIGQAESLFENTDFIKQFRKIAPNEITNQKIMDSIEAYETRRIKPTPLTFQELKELIDA